MDIKQSLGSRGVGVVRLVRNLLMCGESAKYSLAPIGYEAMLTIACHLDPAGVEHIAKHS